MATTQFLKTGYTWLAWFNQNVFMNFGFVFIYDYNTDRYEWLNVR